jgi:hypothetical protein
MARVDDIRVNAIKTLEVYKADPDYQFLCRRAPRLTERQRKDTYVDSVIGSVIWLEAAIEKGDLVTMRRHEQASSDIDSFSRCAERVRSHKLPENEQMTLFDDYSDYEDDYSEDDEWDCEM